MAGGLTGKNIYRDAPLEVADIRTGDAGSDVYSGIPGTNSVECFSTADHILHTPSHPPLHAPSSPEDDGDVAGNTASMSADRWRRLAAGNAAGHFRKLALEPSWLICLGAGSTDGAAPA